MDVHHWSKLLRELSQVIIEYTSDDVTLTAWIQATEGDKHLHQIALREAYHTLLSGARETCCLHLTKSTDTQKTKMMLEVCWTMVFFLIASIMNLITWARTRTSAGNHLS